VVKFQVQLYSQFPLYFICDLCKLDGERLFLFLTMCKEHFKCNKFFCLFLCDSVAEMQQSATVHMPFFVKYLVGCILETQVLLGL
jgi:hypothetical protein